MRLGVKNILKILKGSIVPPAKAIELINDKMWKYYREFKWKTLSNRWASREHCGGLSLLVPYNYHDRVTDEGICINWQSKTSERTYSCLTVNICPSYGGDCNFLLNCDTVPEFTKDLIKLYIDAGWCDAMPIPRHKIEFQKAEGRRQEAEGNPRLKTWD